MITKDSVNKVYQLLHSSSLFKVDESAPGELPILSVVEDNLQTVVKSKKILVMEIAIMPLVSLSMFSCLLYKLITLLV